MTAFLRIGLTVLSGRHASVELSGSRRRTRREVGSSAPTGQGFFGQKSLAFPTRILTDSPTDTDVSGSSALR